MAIWPRRKSPVDLNAFVEARLECVLSERLAGIAADLSPAELQQQAVSESHAYVVREVSWVGGAPYFNEAALKQLLVLPAVIAVLSAEGHLRKTVRVLAQPYGEIFDKHGNAPGIYQLDHETVQAVRRLFAATFGSYAWPVPEVGAPSVEHAQSSAKSGDPKR